METKAPLASRKKNTKAMETPTKEGKETPTKETPTNEMTFNGFLF